MDAGGIYFFADWRENTPFGPRPDYGRQEIRDYIVGNAELWLSEFHADGLRWDSVVNMRQGQNGSQTQTIDQGWPLLQSINEATHALAPGAIQIAEDLQEDALITQTVPNAGAGFDSQWDPAFYYPITSALTTVNDSDRDMNAVSGAISYSYNGQATERLIYTENHDQAAPQNGGERLAQAICPGLAADCLVFAEKRTTLGAAVLLTTPGIPMLFQGQEFVEDTPFPYDQTVGIDWSKQTRYAGIVQLYTDLIHLRENSAAMTAGLSGNNLNVFHVDNTAKVVAYHRYDKGGAGDDVVVVTNFANTAVSNYAIGFPRPGVWHVRFNSDSTIYSSLFGGTASADVTTMATPADGLNQSGVVAVGTYSVIILSQ